MADLGRIVALRERRRDKLRKAEHAAIDACESARKRVTRARNAMDKYAEEVRTLEVDLLRDLMNTQLKKTDFDMFREKLEAAEQKAKSLALKFDKESQLLSRTERNVERARRETQRVAAKLNRISQLDEMFKQDAKEIAIRTEDAASDDIAEMLFGRGKVT